MKPDRRDWCAHSTRSSISSRALASIQRLGAALLGIAILSCLTVIAGHAQAAGPVITVPTANQALQGQVTVTGSTGATNFASAELAFGYSGDATNTWFTIQSLAEPVDAGALATWDTNQVSDGAYVMRLRVFAADGTFQDATVPFEIANYTSPAIASAAPSPTEPPAVQIPSPVLVPSSPTAEPSAVPTPSPFPPNPMALSTQSVYGGVVRGALIALAVLALLGVILLRRHS